MDGTAIAAPAPQVMNREIKVRTISRMLSGTAISGAALTLGVSTSMLIMYFFIAPPAAVSHRSDPTGNGSSPSAAIARMSSVIFIEQYFGPHMLQKWALLNVSCGSVSS